MSKLDDRTAPHTVGGSADHTTILVIDDDEVDRERVRRFLPKAGINATVFEEAEPMAALGALRRLAPDVIVLDYNFPKHDGLSVLREIRELDALTPVIVMTGQDETALAVELMKAGAVDYIPKSGLTPQRLGQSVRHALRLRASEFATRAAEEALRASEEFNRRVLASSHDCIKVLDLEGRLVSMNPIGQRMLGIKDFALVRGASWVDFWKDAHHRAAQSAVDEACAGRASRFVGYCPSQDGTPLWWDVLLTPVLGAEGQPERLLAISRDVTEQRRQTEFEQQLIAIVSHDLRNPIAAMMMAGTLLVKQLPPDSPLTKTAARVVNSGDRASRLIRDLLDFAQVRLGGGLPVDRKEADIHALCRQTVDEIAINHPDRSIVHTPVGDGRGSWDADRMAQVIGNLTRNAVSYSPQGSAIMVRSQGRDQSVRVEVQNHGQPIPADVMRTLFQPFKRGERKHDPERSIGLGLFIIREIVTAHGGSVVVHSTAADGTTFRVDLARE